MLTARATTRIPTTREMADSAINMSFAQGLIADTSVGLNAVAVAKLKVEVVHERGRPVRLDMLRVQHLGEDQGGSGAGARGAGRRATAVEVPEPEREGDDVGEPDGGTAGQQHLGVLGETRHVDDAHDEAHGRVGVGDRDEADEHAGEVVEPWAVPVDAARVADDEDREEDQEEHEEEPGGVAVAQLVGQCRPQQPGGDDGKGHGPARLAPPGPGLRARLGAGRHGAIFPHGGIRVSRPVGSLELCHGPERP